MLKKRPFSLIEVVICIALFTLLLNSLFGWYRHLNDKKRVLEKENSHLVEKRYFLQRLNNIIPCATTPFFYEDGLVFKFDRGLHENPALSNIILCKIYRDTKSNTLFISIWPDPEKKFSHEPNQIFPLLDNVTELEFSYYFPPNPFKKGVDPEHVGKNIPKEGWQKTWLYDYGVLPAIVQMNFTHCGEKQELLFDLNHPIIYPKEPS